MIRNFYRETDRLSPYEEEHILPRIVEILEQCKGFSNSITNKRIIEWYGVAGAEMESRVRKVINYIRNKGIIPCLIATHRGYHIATDAKEITDYEESLKGRESGIGKTLSESMAAMEEERRLFYVAITRTKQQCFITGAVTRFRNGSFSPYEQSSFIKDIDNQYIQKTFKTIL